MVLIGPWDYIIKSPKNLKIGKGCVQLFVKIQILIFVMRKIIQCLVSHFIEFIKLCLNIFKKGSLLKKMLIFVLNLKIFLLVEKFSEVENNKFFCMFPTKISFFSLFFIQNGQQWPLEKNKAIFSVFPFQVTCPKYFH